jgi:hypothetical protein
MTKAHGKSLTPEQNARVREAVRGLLPEYNGVITALAKALGITQAGLSSFLSERTGAGMQLAGAVAKRLHVSLSKLLDGADAPYVYADDGESTRPVWKNRPEWPEASAEALRRNAVLREHPQLVVASGESASLFIAGPLTPEQIIAQALLWLQIGDPAKLQAVEAEESARAAREMNTAIERADRAHQIFHERAGRGEATPPPHQIAKGLEREEKKASRRKPSNDAPPRPSNDAKPGRAKKARKKPGGKG